MEADKSQELAEESKEKKIQWDDAMRAALELIFAPFGDKLQFFSQYQLNKLPYRIDLLIIKKNTPDVLNDVIAEFFRTYNVIENKSPDDHLGIREYFSTQSYAARLIADGFHDDEGGTTRRVPHDGVTMTLIREGRPRRLMKYLTECGIPCQNPHDGIYRFYPPGSVPLQIVAYREIDADQHIMLKALTRRMTADMSRRFGDALQFYRTEDETAKIEIIMQIIDRLNMQFMKGENVMLEWMQSKVEHLTQIRLAESEAKGIEIGEARGVKIGEEKGKVIGIRMGLLDTAVRMLEGGLSLEQIVKFTGLPLSEVAALQKA